MALVSCLFLYAIDPIRNSTLVTYTYPNPALVALPMAHWVRIEYKHLKDTHICCIAPFLC